MTRRQAALLISVSLLGLFSSSALPASETARVHAMWVWNTDDILLDAAGRDAFLKEAKALGLTEVYLFLRASDYIQKEVPLGKLLAAMHGIGVRAWGLEGWRGYFSDVEGPASLYAAADAMVAYNQRNSIPFVGFQSDMEPQDGQGVGQNLFANGVPQSRLSSDQLAARDRILTEWLEIHAALLKKTREAGVAYGSAIPSWVDEYMGEPLQATFSGVRKPLIEHLMPLVSQYVIMSYSTKPSNVIKKIAGELQRADLVGSRRIVFGLETHAGAGMNISYADTPDKKQRAAVLADLKLIEEHVLSHPSYLGWALHDWTGWSILPKRSSSAAIRLSP
ncbi:MAG: hypothetical protein J0G33_08240 [Afipia felis]|nr:hypothetical protein [Afipia felis]